MAKVLHWLSTAIVLAAALATSGFLSSHLRANQVEKMDTIATRMKELEDREEIRQLLTDYGQNLDRRNFAALSQLFADREGEWMGSFGRAKGREAIRMLMDKNIGTGTSRKVRVTYSHLFTNETIQVNGDRAQATAKWILLFEGSGNRPQPFALGHFDESLIREKGRWKFLQLVSYGEIPQTNPITAR